MNLYLLRPVEGDPAWKPWYDKMFGFVVRAETESEARAMAQAMAGDEARDDNFQRTTPIWTDAARTTCVELNANSGEPGVVISDFHAA